MGGKMVAKRKTDYRTHPHFRSERFVEEGGGWFFYTREGTMEGPCEDMIEASIRLEKYLSVLESGFLSESGELSLQHWAKKTA
jgi:hypothetical protein